MGNAVYATAIHTFQDAETGAANGTAMDVGGLAAIGIQVEGVSGETITFEGTIDGTTWYAVQVVNLNNGAVGTTTTADGMFLAPTAGLDLLRCRISTANGGTVTIIGKGVVNAAGMTLADIDIAGQEDFNLAQVGGTNVDANSGNKSAGSQRVVIATDDVNLAAINAVSGTTAGAAVITDANGTVQQYLRGLVKLIAAKIGITIADGDDASIGATSVAAVITDTTGTVQGKLRGLVKWAFERMPAALGQGTMAQSLPVVIASDQAAHSVKVDQTTPGTTNKVVADVPTATPTSYNVTCTVADTEYSQALPTSCRFFEFQARTEATVRYAFVTGKVAGPTEAYHTLKAGDYYNSPQLNQGAAPSTLYVASPTAGTVVELLAWA